MKKEDKVQAEVVDYIIQKKTKKLQYRIVQMGGRFFALGILMISSDPTAMLGLCASILFASECIGVLRDLVDL